MNHPVCHFITKVTAVIPEMIYFRRKTYYEDKKQKNRCLKGGVLYVSNHVSFWDYLCYFFVVYFKKLRPVVSTLMYRKNPVLRFFLNMVGAIVVGNDDNDLSFIDKCVSLLRKGKKIIIFPEAHFVSDGKIRDFSPSFALIALKANVPVVPMYIDGQYSFAHRTHVMIGRRVNPFDVAMSADLEGAKVLTNYIKEKVIFLQDITERRKKSPLFQPRLFPMDFGRFLLGLVVFWPAYRTRKHFPADYKSPKFVEGPVIIACNHRSFLDATILISAFWRRRLWVLIAKEVFGNTDKDHRIRKKLLKDIGGIKIDREKMDIEAINKCCDNLNKGRALLVFPEGHLNHDGGTAPIKDGVSMIACQTNTPVLPIFLCQGKRFFSTRHIYAGELIYPQGKGMDGVKKTSLALSESIASLRELAIKEGREHE